MIRVLWMFVFRCRFGGLEQWARLEVSERATLATERARLAERIAQACAEYGFPADGWDCCFADVWLPEEWHCWHEAELNQVA